MIREKDTGSVVYESEGDTYDLKENTALYSFLGHPVDVESGKTYELEIRSDAPENCGLGLYCVTGRQGKRTPYQLPGRGNAGEEQPADVRDGRSVKGKGQKI